MNTSKKLIVCALAGLSAGSALALDSIKVGEANVSAYARIVAGVEYTDNLFAAGVQGSRMRTAANQWGTSYWGVRADLPLDNGFAAVANLESGFGTDTGATNESNVLFNRAANVGLKHASYGTLTVGTHLWIAQDIEDMDPMSFQVYGINSLVNGVNDGAAQSSVLYRSPNVYGFEAAYMHKFGGVVGSAKRSSGDGVSLAYANAGLKLRAIYAQQADEFGRYSGGDYYGLGSQEQWKYTKNLVLGASYAFGPATLFAGYERVKAPESGYGINATFDDKARMVWLGANYQLTPKAKLLGGVYQLKQTVSDKKATLVSVGTNYDWNKYLTLYATLGHVGNGSISSAMTSNAGASDHALSYQDTACEESGNCNGAKQFGGYAGFALKF